MAMNKVLVWALVLAMMPAGGQAYAADNIDGLINGLFCKDEQGVHVCADFIPADGIFYYGTYPNGKLIGKGYAKGGSFLTRLSSYFEYWQLGAEENYKEVMRDWVYKSYYKSGQLEEEENYKDGKPEGVSKMYHKNGQLWLDVYYKDGELEGGFKRYYENGQLVTEECFM